MEQTPQIPEAQQIVMMAGRLLGLSLEAEAKNRRDLVDHWFLHLSDLPSANTLQKLLELIQQRTGADTGKLFFSLPGEENSPTFFANSPETPGTRGMKYEHCTPCDCGSLLGGCGIVLEGDRLVHDISCVASVHEGEIFWCLPIKSETELLGAIQLGFTDTPHLTGSRRHPFLLDMARAIGTNLAIKLKNSTHIKSQYSDLNCNPRPRLVIRCFGAFRVEMDEKELGPGDFPRKGAIDLLKMISLNCNSSLSHFQLAEWLWPEIDEDRTINRLFVLVHSLRTVLSTNQSIPTMDKIIHRAPGAYMLTTNDEIWIDVVVFRSLISQGLRLHRTGHADEAAVILQKAVDLYTGDLFEDSPYADWCDLDREHLRRSYLNALDLLANYRQASGNTLDAIFLLQLAVSKEPLREDLQQRLIRMLIAQGRREEARSHYDKCLWLIRNELQLEPLLETIHLERLFQSGPA